MWSEGALASTGEVMCLGHGDGVTDNGKTTVLLAFKSHFNKFRIIVR